MRESGGKTKRGYVKTDKGRYANKPREASRVTAIPTQAPEPLDCEPESLQLEGRKAVLEALNHKKCVDRLLIRKDAGREIEGTLRLIAAKAREAGIVVREMERAKLDEISETQNHQGVIAVCPAKEYVEVDDILQSAADRGEKPFVIVLDGITDPHNLGAIIRTAEAGGAHGVIIPKRRAAGLTGTVAKTSAGAIEHVNVARVTNVTRTLEDLKKAGLWIICADVGGTPLYGTDFSGPVALLIGAEGEGVSRLAAQSADFKARIPMLGKIEALNASVAAGVLIYEVVRARHYK
ncbi:MAG: 23S rRNA (guanosine(2251)-2'-O)-methyltransferase RlmB [Defluviitaleaceae bacterium]|nr:23S rRNA (guanosine(2251)-2'-O)-methyltransferase RlmB [Defluviitaleaceae bacterium]